MILKYLLATLIAVTTYITIKFIHDITFNLKVNYIPGYYRTTRTPGQLTEEEISNFREFNELLKIIPEWCREIRNELKAGAPIYNEIDALRETIESHISSSSSESDDFSVEEINDLRKKFDELQERVEQLEKDKIITEKQLAEFTQGLSQIDEDIEFYPKATWIKTTANKLTKIVLAIGKSKEGRKIISDGARKLLGME